MMARIVLSPPQALVDEVVRVVVRGLNPRQRVTVSTLLEERRKVYTSSGLFTADSEGNMDLSKMPSQGGTYTGVSPMGLFWSMKPTLDMRKGTRLMKQDVTTPLVTRMYVHDGHLTAPDPRHVSAQALATGEVRRWYKDPQVKRVEVNQDGVRGTLFIPPGNKRHPGVIDVFGSVGGIVEFRAALLASRGFVTLALGYIFYDEDPAYKEELEYFEKAVDLLLDHPRVLSGGVGMVGTSKGSDVVLALSVVCPKVKAVVSIGGLPWNAGSNHTYKGWFLPCTGLLSVAKEDGRRALEPIDGSYVPVDSEDGMSYKIYPEKVSPACFIPVERTHAKLMLISGDDDPFVPDSIAYIIPDRLRRAGRHNLCQVLRYKRAGHLIEPPYSPHSRSSYSPTGMTLWGGYPEEHAEAQENSWQRILRFFRENIPHHPCSKL